ncbi:MAG: hypothetical protein K2X32_11825 [Phycisphaerales bacterium]|nr:hypothetical protein [Phycisphaerales bacterium]
MPTWSNWAHSRCVAVDTAVMMPCGNFNQFLVTEQAVSGVSQKCCGDLSVTSGVDLSAGGSVQFGLCGALFSVDGEWRQTASVTTTFTGANPCGCVQVFVQRDWRVQRILTAYTRCYPNGRREEWQEMKTVADALPLGARLVPYYFTRVPSPCNCGSDGRPLTPGAAPSTGWNPALPHGFPTVQPNNRPVPEAVPWDVDVHGPLRSSTDVYPDGRDKQLTIDMTAWGVARGIDSPLALTLFECAEVYRSINEARQSPHLCGDKTAVRVVINRGVEFVGSLGKLSSSLIAYANTLVNSPTYGDFNGDESRDEADLTLLYAHVNVDEPPADSRRFDVNGDGAVDELDVQKWIELVLG